MAKVTLRCIECKDDRKMIGRIWSYSEPDVVIIGRDASAAKIVVPATVEKVSRWNSILEIIPPYIYASDTGSLNGTYVNGKLIGKREKGISISIARKAEYPKIELFNGAKLGIGGKNNALVFEVKIVDDDETIPAGYAQNSVIEKADISVTSEKFEINALKKIKTIGQGGFGHVSLMEDVRNGMKYAMKEIIPARNVRSTMEKWFLREANICTQLRHPNIVHGYKLVHDKGNYRLYMEYCSGGSVRELLVRNRGPLSLNCATDIIIQLLDALDYVHNMEVEILDINDIWRKERGLVHRDIKPDNLLFEDESKRIVKLADFGLAKAFNIAGMTGNSSDATKVGSWRYCSRRQYSNYRFAKPDVDIFSAAACYYELLTNQHVREFGNSNNWDAMIKVAKEPIVPIEERNGNIPIKLARVIDRVLREEDENDNYKFTTAKQFKEEILHALA